MLNRVNRRVNAINPAALIFNAPRRMTSLELRHDIQREKITLRRY